MYCKICGRQRSIDANFCPHCGTAFSAKYSDPYADDAPLKDPSLDELDRWQFSQGIAQTIASRRDPTSIVVGIYGSWGQGKSTVINFIESELKSNYSDVIYVRFNPWMLGD
jgi:predicted KAP-like P-loop ATPase